MLLTALIFALLIYLVFRVVGNLLQAVREDARGTGVPPSLDPFRRAQQAPRRRARPKAPRRRTTRVPEPDIEDAKWEDL